MTPQRSEIRIDKNRRVIVRDKRMGKHVVGYRANRSPDIFNSVSMHVTRIQEDPRNCPELIPQIYMYIHIFLVPEH